jgi:hypothetical protein
MESYYKQSNNKNKITPLDSDGIMLGNTITQDNSTHRDNNNNSNDNHNHNRNLNICNNSNNSTTNDNNNDDNSDEKENKKDSDTNDKTVAAARGDAKHNPVISFHNNIQSHIPQCLLDEGYLDTFSNDDDDDGNDGNIGSDNNITNVYSDQMSCSLSHNDPLECDSNTINNNTNSNSSSHSGKVETPKARIKMKIKESPTPTPLRSKREVIQPNHLCPTCKDVFLSPVTLLPCNHKFCKYCLIGLDIESKRRDSIFFSLPHKCPVCRTKGCCAVRDAFLSSSLCKKYPLAYQRRRRTIQFNTLVSKNRKQYYNSQRFNNVCQTIDNIFTHCPIYDSGDFYSIFTLLYSNFEDLDEMDDFDENIGNENDDDDDDDNDDNDDNDDVSKNDQMEN